jgi:isocitrate lyase
VVGRGATIDYFAPIVADAEAGFGGVLNAFELMKAMIEAGAAGVHFEDQLASAKVRPHGRQGAGADPRSGREADAARLAADVMGTSTLLIARTDAEAADLLIRISTTTTSRSAPASARWRATSRCARGWSRRARAGLCAVRRPGVVRDRPAGSGLRQRFAEAVHARPGKMLAYNCSPSFNWKEPGRRHHRPLPARTGAMGYKFQFITLAGFHALNYGMFHLAHGYARRQMPAFVELQEAEFAAAERGTAVKHQREVGTGYFDAVTQCIQSGWSSTTALHGSTEDEQFFEPKVA